MPIFLRKAYAERHDCLDLRAPCLDSSKSNHRHKSLKPYFQTTAIYFVSLSSLFIIYVSAINVGDPLTFAICVHFAENRLHKLWMWTQLRRVSIHELRANMMTQLSRSWAESLSRSELSWVAESFLSSGTTHRSGTPAHPFMRWDRESANTEIVDIDRFTTPRPRHPEMTSYKCTVRVPLLFRPITISCPVSGLHPVSLDGL